MICETIDASYSELYPYSAVEFFKKYHSEKKIAERSLIGETLVLIFKRDGSILATGSLIDSEIIGVFVRSDYQGKGYGRIIMTQLEQIAAEKGILKLHLSISLASRRFYEHLGYQVLEECVVDVGGGECLRYWFGSREVHPRD